MLLLHSLGIEMTTFIHKQLQYFEYLEQSRADATCAFRLLSSLGMISEAEELLIEGMENVIPTIRRTIAQEYN